MTSKKEILHIIAAILLMTLVLTLSEILKLSITSEILMVSLLFAVIIILASVLSKKFVASIFDMEIEHRIWQTARYGIEKSRTLKKPFPLGLAIPLLILLLFKGVVKFFAFLEFNSIALPTKVVKRWGKKRFSGVLEWEEGLIAFFSTLILLIFSLALSLITLPGCAEISRYTLFYVFSNLIPLGHLDGTKIFMGSRPLFIFTLIVTIIFSLFILL